MESRLFVSTKGSLHYPDVDMRIGRAAVHGQGAAEAVEGFLGAPEGCKCDAVIGQHIGVIRTERERAFEMLRRLRVPIEAEERHPKLNVRLRLLGNQLYPFLQWFDRLREAPKGDQHRPAADQIRRRHSVTRQQLV